jgi:nitroreductase
MGLGNWGSYKRKTERIGNTIITFIIIKYLKYHIYKKYKIMQSKKNSLLDIIKSRRSTRRFKKDMVPEKDLTAVLEAARWAPSGDNSQPWKFIVIKNKETMVKIVDLIPYKKFQAFLKNAPILICIVVNSRRSRWVVLDGCLSIQNLMLEAWARGLGTCFSAWYPTVPKKIKEKVKELLKIPKNWIIITFTPLGFPVNEPERAFRIPPSRKSLNELVCYEKFEK